MKFPKYCFLVLIVIFTCCKSGKNVINTNKIAKKMSVKKVIRKHLRNKFDKKTLDAKFKANYDNGNMNTGFSLRMKIKKDSLIWLKATKFITVFKFRATPDSISYYSPLKREYFKGSFSILKKLLGVKVTFEQLQNILLGQAISDLKKEKRTVKIQDNSYVLSPEDKTDIWNVFLYINPTHFRLDKQSIIGDDKKLTVVYPKYSIKNDVVFPDQIKINATNKNKITRIDMIIKSIDFDNSPNMTFQIPQGYKRLQF